MLTYPPPVPKDSYRLQSPRQQCDRDLGRQVHAARKGVTRGSDTASLISLYIV
jgi:hypothetical protein